MLPNESLDSFILRLDWAIRTLILSETPIKPIQDNETDRLVKKLSTCGKIAFIDTTENIAAILPFLNDNPDHIKYLTGVEPFFKASRGWLIYPVRGNYAERRLQIMVSSGIYGHWENWYRLLKTRRLFHIYANWTFPKFDAVSQLNHNSKVVTGFYISGIFLVGCFLCLGYEVLN